ncbi:hypothetical protein EDB85DRAFT_2186419 [Lactarius pseudohatsudake]|nr:hypothetical protein EDB85DRAFT_2186419 [Lactarius pseudohatsudake]
MLRDECISVGMILEGEVTCQLGHFSQVGVGCLTRCLKSYNLSVLLSGPRITGLPASRFLTVDRLLGIMKIGKKNSGSEKKIVLLATIGKTVEQKASVVPHPIIAKTLAEAAEVIPGVNGSQIQYLESECCLPLSTRSNLMASRVGGSSWLQAYLVNVSSILLCAPYAQEPVTLELIGGQDLSIIST